MEDLWTKLLAGISVVTLVAVGAFYGDTRARLSRIEKSLYNGQYATKEEVTAKVDRAKVDHEKIDREIHRLWDRMEQLQRKRNIN